MVVLTSSREEQDIVQSSKMGINGYILKPVDMNQFRETAKQFAMSWLLVDAPTPDGTLAEK